MMKWTTEKFDELATLKANGFSNLRIAEHFNTTEQSIIGAVYRFNKVRRISRRSFTHWTPELVDRLIRLRKEPAMKASMIASELGVSEAAARYMISRLIRQGKIMPVKSPRRWC